MSGTIPAIDAREKQQQDIVQELYEKAVRIDMDQDEPYLFSADVAQLLLGYLVAELRGVPWALDPEATHSEEEIFVETILVARVRQFALTPSERGLVLFRILERLLSGSLGQFQPRWTKETMQDPMATLGAKSRMEEVPIP